MEMTWFVLDEAPGLFESGVNPEIYIKGYTHELERHSAVVKRRKALIEHAEKMALAWKGLLEEIKSRWPEVLAEIIDRKS